MKYVPKSAAAVAMGLIALFAVAQGRAPESPDLTGLWQATLRLGPDVRGALTIHADDDGSMSETIWM